MPRARRRAPYRCAADAGLRTGKPGAGIELRAGLRRPIFHLRAALPAVYSDNSEMNDLSETARKFILHWGEMGTRWGINRTVAQIHALLFISENPLNAEEIGTTLGVARSNVSTSLKELQNWGIVRRVHLPNDRRDHFESLQDVFEMFRIIGAERKRREIDPTLRVIRECLGEAGSAGIAVMGRLLKLLEFFELIDLLSRQMERVPTRALVRAARMGDSIFRLLGFPGVQESPPSAADSLSGVTPRLREAGTID
jgi:hypothetical protein